MQTIETFKYIASMMRFAGYEDCHILYYIASVYETSVLFVEYVLAQ